MILPIVESLLSPTHRVSTAATECSLCGVKTTQNRECVRNTLVGASQRMLVEAGQAGPDGRSHRRLDGRQILGFTQVSQHVLQLTAVRPWNTAQPPHVIGETPAKYSPASTNRSIPPSMLRLDLCFSTLVLSTHNTAHVSLFWPVSGAGVSSNELN